MATLRAAATLGLQRTTAVTSSSATRIHASLLTRSRWACAPPRYMPNRIRYSSSSSSPPPSPPPSPSQPSIAAAPSSLQNSNESAPPPAPTGAAGHPEPPPKRPVQSRLQRLRSSRAFRTAILVVQMAALFHLIIEHVGEVRICVGPSMIPTVAPAGDVLFHVRLPALQAWNRIMSVFGSPPKTDNPALAGPADKYKWSHSKYDRTFGLPLQVGDLVTAFSPKDPKRQVCKRIIGLPGDTVLVDPRHPYGPSLGPGVSITEASYPFDLASHPLPPRGPHEGNDDDGDDDDDEMLKPHYVTVPTGHVWLSGDNLANSIDSRRYGPVPMGCIKGKVIAKVWPEWVWLNRDNVTLLTMRDQ